jgi:cytochrome c
MKIILTIVSSVLFLISCGNNSDTKEKSTNITDNNKSTGTTDPDAAKGLALVAKSDCFTCHKLTETSIGPAYALIAAKYKTLDQPAMDSIVSQIINGGSGRWGTVPMTPHLKMPKADAELMAHYIMSIKK